MYHLGIFIGAFFFTGILSRIFWLVAKRWPDSIGKASALDLAAGIIAGLLAAIGAADGGPPQIGAALPYLAAGGLLIALDAVRLKRKPFTPN